MAKTPKKKPYFLCCFGFSRKGNKFSEKISSSVNKDHQSSTKFCSWSMFRMKNSSAKTVPLDTSISINSPDNNATADADLSKNKIHSSSNSASKSKWQIRKLLLITTNNKHKKNSTTKTAPFPSQVTTLVKSDVLINEEEATTHTHTLAGSEQDNNNLESRKSLDHRHADTSKEATCRKRLSFRRKIDAIRAGSVPNNDDRQPGSHDVVIKPKQTTTASNRALLYSVSMPAPTRIKRANTFLSKSPKKTRQDDNNVRMVNRFDPVVGMSIIMVTLIIMFVWGRLCAILCTSAWLYFVPRLRDVKIDDDAAMVKINGDQLDLNSQEYKKRVVLEGFLERDHRAV